MTVGFDRRHFLLGTASFLTISAMSPADALLLRGSAANFFQPSARSVINMNFSYDNEYHLIDASRMANYAPNQNNLLGNLSGVTVTQAVDQNGYVNQAGFAGSVSAIGAFTSPASSNFSGPWVATWDGDGTLDFQTSSGSDSYTWTESNLVTPGTGTFTNGSASIGFTNSFSAGQQVVFSTTGTLPTNFSLNTVYYVVSTGLSGSAFQVSATKGGSAIVAGSAGSGTQTVNGTYTRFSNGTWLNRPGIKAYIVFNLTGLSTAGQPGFTYSSTGGTPVAVSSYSWSSGILTVNTTSAHGRQVGSQLYLTLQGTSVSALNNLTAFATITSATQFTIPVASNPGTVATPGTFTAFITNMKVYRQADEADLLAGNIFRSAWKQEIAKLNPSAIRFMNWNYADGNLYSFLDRTTPNVNSWGGASTGPNLTVGPAYGRTTGYNNWSLAAATGTTSNPKTTPVSMTHGETAVFQVGQGGMMGAGPQVQVTNIQNQVNPTVTTSSAHNLFAGDQIWFTIETGMTQLNGNSYIGNAGSITVLSVTDSTHFVISRDTTSYSSWITAATNFFTRTVGTLAVTAISNATNAKVTSANHGMSVNDVVSLTGITAAGWGNLNLFPATVQSVVDANNFTINFNSSALGAFSGSANCVLYITLNVGGRGAYPIIQQGGTFPSAYNNNYVAEASYHCWHFDKTISGQTDGSGNYVLGAWVYDSGFNIPGFDVPIEVCVACVNEVNATAVSLGINNPIHMYYCCTMGGIDSNDPDQTTSTRWAQNAVNVILNGANGYSGLTAKADLYLEYGNEMWNGLSGGGQAQYMAWRGVCRWVTSGSTNPVDMSLLRMTGQAIDVANAFPSQTGNLKTNRIRRVLGAPPNQGSAKTDVYGQYWFTGAATTFYANDNLVTSGGWGAPGTHHECINIAPYAQPKNSYYGGSGTGSFTDDSAMFNGTSPYSSPNQTQAINNFVAQVSIAGGVGGPSDTTLFSWFNYYVSVISTWLPPGKFYVEYEGAATWQTAPSTGDTSTWLGGVHQITANDSLFLLAISDSAQWGAALTAYFNAMAALPHVGMPACYVIIQPGAPGDQIWAYAAPDTYGNTSTEGQALLNNGAWAAMSGRNQALAF